MQLDPREMAPTVVYKLLIGCVVPRPIAWVSTVDADGVNNLAPFSSFMGVCGDPPTIAFSSGPREGQKKDTAANAARAGEFVVNVVDDPLAEAMNLTSGEYPPGVDEFALTGLTAVPGVRVGAPRVAEAPISLECRLSQIINVGCGPHQLVLGEIVYFHIRDELYNAETGRIDMHCLHPVARLAGADPCLLSRSEVRLIPTVPRRSPPPDRPHAARQPRGRPSPPPRGSGSVSGPARRARSSFSRSTVTASSACGIATMPSGRSGSKPWSSSSPSAIGNRHRLAFPPTRSSGCGSPLPTLQSATA